jgi:hypothetical protein
MSTAVRRVKDDDLRVRVDEEFRRQLDAYCATVTASTGEELTVSALVRKALKAWMRQNPASNSSHEAEPREFPVVVTQQKRRHHKRRHN